MPALKFFKVTELAPPLEPSAFYFVARADGSADAYLTDNLGAPHPVGNRELTLRMIEESPPPIASDAAGVSFRVQARQAIVAGQVACIDADGLAVLASADNLVHASSGFAIATESVVAFATVELRRVGIVDGGWAFTPGRRVYLGLAGELTQSPSAGLYQLDVGLALTASRLLFDPSAAIVRAP